MLLSNHFLNFLNSSNLNKGQLVVSTFYKFIQLNKINEIKELLNGYLKDLNIKGTILLAGEGINGTICGGDKDTLIFFEKITLFSQFKDLEPKYSVCNTNPFLRMKVRLKSEIVNIGNKQVNPEKLIGKYIKPLQWNKIINDKDTMIIDTRNNYEVSIGTFKNSINPKINSFREFPNWVKKNLIDKKVSKSKKIAMFCTGGIRCEKSTSYLKKIGYENVFHLEGGILKYLEKVSNLESKWLGECFVFDYRVSVQHGLKVGNFEMCFACRMPLSEENKKHRLFEEGKSCHYCYNKTSKSQKLRFKERQKQVLLSKKNNQNHIGPKS